MSISSLLNIHVWAPGWGLHPQNPSCGTDLLPLSSALVPRPRVPNRKRSGLFSEICRVRRFGEATPNQRYGEGQEAVASSAGILPAPSLVGARCLTGRAPGTRGAQQVHQPEHLLLSEISRLALAPRGNPWLHDLGSPGADALPGAKEIGRVHSTCSQDVGPGPLQASVSLFHGTRLCRLTSAGAFSICGRYGCAQVASRAPRKASGQICRKIIPGRTHANNSAPGP